MAGRQDRVVALKASRPSYGISAELVLPTVCWASGPDKHNYFDAYLGMDWYCEAGIFRYGTRFTWTVFLNCCGKIWVENAYLFAPGARVQMKLVLDDSRNASFYLNNSLFASRPLKWAIPPQIYNQGGPIPKACHGAVDENSSVYYNRMEWRNVQLRTTEKGDRYESLGSNFYLDKKEAQPFQVLSQSPLVTTYRGNYDKLPAIVKQVATR